MSQLPTPSPPHGHSDGAFDEALTRPLVRRPAGPPPAPASDAAPAGTPAAVGRYHVLGLLGEGGMGAVYLAEQASTGQRVALKVIRPGQLDAESLARFETETRVLARLKHPGIAQVHDAGTIDLGSGPQPFFAMELVEGRTLLEHAAGLPAREKLELIARTCDAVQHAHQKGVVHRDLKPANVVVDAAGQPKVLDFGVARATDSDLQASTLATDVREIVGTLPYMSPEQLAGDPGDLDSRSDVYALGVMLYELLAGAHPHDVTGRSLTEAIRVVTAALPRRLSALDPALRGDVETIVSKAMAREKERRYDSAAALAADLRRHLEDQPILARPASAAYVLGKIARRHRGVVAGSALALAGLLAGLVVLAWALDRTRNERAAAEAARDRARAEAAKAEAVHRFLVDDVLAAATPEVAQGRDITVREALDSASASVERAFGAQPDLRLTGHQTLGQTYFALGHLDEAEAHLRQGLALARRVRGPGDRETLLLERTLAAVLGAMDRLDEALPMAESAERELARVAPADDPDLAEARADRAALLMRAGRPAEAEPILRRSLAILEAGLGPDDRRTQIVRHNLATALGDAGRLDEARAELEALLEARRASLGDRHPDTLATIANLAANLAERDRLEEAETLLREVLEAREAVLGPEHPSTLTTRLNLTNVLIRQGRLAEAEPLVRHDLEVRERTLGPSHQATLMTLNQLAVLMEDLGRLDEAEAIHRRSLEAWSGAVGATHPQALIGRNNLAMLLGRQGHHDEAGRMFESLLVDARAALPPGSPMLGIFGSNLGASLIALGRNEDAERVLVESRELLAAAFGPDHDRTRTADERLAAARAAR